jgi:anti-anti-sigma factor
MKINLVSIEKEGVIRLATDGAITAGDFDSSGINPLQGLLGQNWNTMRVLINFEKTDYIDSSAIGWLIGTSKILKGGGGAIVIYNVQPAVRQILDVLKVGKVVPMADDEAAAREVLAGSAAATGGAR